MTIFITIRAIMSALEPVWTKVGLLFLEKILIFLAFWFFYMKGMVKKYFCTNFQKNRSRDEVVRADGRNSQRGGEGGESVNPFLGMNQNFWNFFFSLWLKITWKNFQFFFLIFYRSENWYTGRKWDSKQLFLSNIPPKNW